MKWRRLSALLICVRSGAGPHYRRPESTRFRFRRCPAPPSQGAERENGTARPRRRDENTARRIRFRHWSRPRRCSDPNDNAVRHSAALNRYSCGNRLTRLTCVKRFSHHTGETPSTSLQEGAGGRNRNAFPPEGSSMEQSPNPSPQHVGALGGAAIRGA